MAAPWPETAIESPLAVRGEQRGTLADHVHHAADVELAIVNRSQVVGDACSGTAISPSAKSSTVRKS